MAAGDRSPRALRTTTFVEFAKDSPLPAAHGGAVEAHLTCPVCGASWAREQYQPGDRVVVTCGNGHCFLVAGLRSAAVGGGYIGLTPVEQN